VFNPKSLLTDSQTLHFEATPPENLPLPGGTITRVEILRHRPFFLAKRRTKNEAKARGLAFERLVTETLLQRYELDYHPNLWLLAWNSSNRHFYCEVDGVLFIDTEPKRLVAIEIKYRHTERAWWQLRHKYEPILRHSFPSYSVAVCELCKVFDPSTPFPEPITFQRDLRACPPDKFSVHLWL
jgi:hypothetical protein